MSVEDFIKKEYGTRSLTSTRAVTNKSRRKKKTNESFEKYFAKFYNPKAEGSLAKQRVDMRERSADYQAMVQAGVISSVKQGRTLVDKLQDEETRPEVTRYMANLDDKQISQLKDVVDKNLNKRFSPFTAPIYIGGFNAMIKDAKAIREEQNKKQDITLGFGNVVKKGAEIIGDMVDQKGFSVDIDPFSGEYFVRYKKEF
tara:strand:+ start:82 stop:681 length:600 start_codon:yes stop_codon:yes gene_type:complete